MNAPMPLAAARAAPNALAINDDEMLDVMRSSIYPGAKDASIKAALSYCRAARLDPLQKPVHIVPMRVKVPGGRGNEYEWRDVILPGVGLYRTQAARTGAFVGLGEPEFGPTRTLTVGENAYEYPEWCRITVKRLVGGVVAEFVALEYWAENYATAGRDTKAPNQMWERRAWGQLAKCTEAQALRKGFPEVGALPTAEEMEGRFYAENNGDDPDESGARRTAAMPGRRSAQKSIAHAPDEPATFSAQQASAAAAGAVEVLDPEPAAAQTSAQRDPAPARTATAPASSAALIEPGAAKFLARKMAEKGVDESALQQKFGIASTAEVTEDLFEPVRQWVYGYRVS